MTPPKRPPGYRVADGCATCKHLVVRQASTGVYICGLHQTLASTGKTCDSYERKAKR